MLFAISLLCLADHIKLFFVVQEKSLALKTLNIHLEFFCAKDIGVILDHDLEKHCFGDTFEELIVSAPEN